MISNERAKVKDENSKCDKHVIDYLLKIHDSIQDMVIKTEDRSIGATNITVVASVLVMIISKYGDNAAMCYLLFPVGVLTVLSLYTYHNRVSAILRGYLAGIEDVLAQKNR